MNVVALPPAYIPRVNSLPTKCTDILHARTPQELQDVSQEDIWDKILDFIKALFNADDKAHKEAKHLFYEYKRLWFEAQASQEPNKRVESFLKIMGVLTQFQNLLPPEYNLIAVDLLNPGGSPPTLTIRVILGYESDNPIHQDINFPADNLTVLSMLKQGLEAVSKETAKAHNRPIEGLDSTCTGISIVAKTCERIDQHSDWGPFHHHQYHKGLYYVNNCPAQGGIGNKDEKCYYINGYLANGHYRLDGERDILVSAHDNRDVTYYKNGRLFNGFENECYYVQGKPANGEYNGYRYENGQLFTGIKEGTYYAEGRPGDGEYNGYRYANGQLFTGFVNTQQEFGTFIHFDSTLYINGKLANEEYDGKRYENGRLLNGKYEGVLYLNGNRNGSGEYAGLMYHKGQPLTGMSGINGCYYHQGKPSRGEVKVNVDGQLVVRYFGDDSRPLNGVDKDIYYKDGYRGPGEVHLDVDGQPVVRYFGKGGIPLNGVHKNIYYKDGFRGPGIMARQDGILTYFDNNGKPLEGIVVGKRYINAHLGQGEDSYAYIVNDGHRMSVDSKTQEEYRKIMDRDGHLDTRDKESALRRLQEAFAGLYNQVKHRSQLELLGQQLSYIIKTARIDAAGLTLGKIDETKVSHELKLWVQRVFHHQYDDFGLPIAIDMLIVHTHQNAIDRIASAAIGHTVRSTHSANQLDNDIDRLNKVMASRVTDNLDNKITIDTTPPSTTYTYDGMR